MKLTVVLVTQPARVDYFAESLECIAEALEKHLELELLVIFNGKSDSGEDKLKPIQDAFPTRVSSRIIEVNNPMPDSFFKIIREENLRWIHMPGDDDLVIPKAYSAFFDLMSEENSYVAVGFSAIAVNSEGTPSGKVLKPLDFNNERKERILAVALHKPLFVWPSLIFDATVVPETLFSSRFVFDWWIGIQLTLAGSVQTELKPLVKYRVHENQESFHAPEARKRFEAEIMLHSILTEDAFWKVLRSFDDLQLFFNEINKHQPVFADPHFGGSIYCTIINKFPAISSLASTVTRTYIGRFASTHNAFLNMSQFPSKSAALNSPDQVMNFQGDVLNGTCEKVAQSLNRILGWQGPFLASIGCNHSRHTNIPTTYSVIVDCGDLTSIMPKEIDSLVIQQLEVSINQKLENESHLAPWERSLIFFARGIVTKSRKFLNYMRFSYARKIKERD